MIDINAIYEKSEFQFSLNKNSLNIFKDLENEIKKLANLNDDCVLLFNLTNDLSSIEQNNINEVIEKYKNKTIKIFVRVKEKKIIEEENKKKNNFNFDDINFKKENNEQKNDNLNGNINNLNENNNIEEIKNEENDEKNEKNEDNNENNNEINNNNKTDEISLDTEKLLEEVLKSTRESEYILNNTENNENKNNNNNNNNIDNSDIINNNTINSLDLKNNNFFPTPKPNLIQINNGNNFEVKEIENNQSNINNKISTKNKNKNNIFSNEICSICKEHLNSIKFMCCICDNCILCEKCEKSHNHCVIKYKNHFISDFFDTFLFIKRMNNNSNVSVKSKIKEIFSQNSLDVKIFPKIDDQILIKINEKYSFPIIIDNQSKENINSNNSILLFKNNKNVNFFFDNKKLDVKSKRKIELYITISSKKICKEFIDIELFSSILHFKEKNFIKFSLEIEVNNEGKNNSEKLLDNNFNDSPMLKECSLNHKKLILEIFNKNLNVNKLQIHDYLMKNKWDKNKTLEILMKNKKKK